MKQSSDDKRGTLDAYIAQYAIKEYDLIPFFNQFIKAPENTDFVKDIDVASFYEKHLTEIITARENYEQSTGTLLEIETEQSKLFLIHFALRLTAIDIAKYVGLSIRIKEGEYILEASE